MSDNNETMTTPPPPPPPLLLASPEVLKLNDTGPPPLLPSPEVVKQSEVVGGDGDGPVVKVSGIPAPKVSGLKQPSKIGRPCLGMAKPGLPPVPKNGTDADTRTRDESYRRQQRLTDVEEEVDETDAEAAAAAVVVVDDDRRTDTPTARKTRTYSDASVVLTEDTDAFIIGMRVWVGGTKPGQIAYLGETQFAPGEWAGIVLDDPIGKNDGSVSGTRYFQCEAKRGVFSRLTRLTLAPLPAELAAAHSPPVNGAKQSPTSPAGSTRSLQRATPSLHASTASLAASTTAAAAAHDLKLGDRVIVQSSQGSKAGTLRFLGAADFAKGDWCGVELDEPLGKNDGSVEGKRYFTCPFKFGLFAPVSKVSRSPSSRRPAAQCVVHRTSTPSLRRTGSRESMASVTSMTSATSSSVRRKPIPKATSTPLSKTLQDVLREKEHHIEQLLREREIDRSEITRAATQREQVAGQLLSVQQDYEKYRLDAELKVRDHGAQLVQLEKRRDELAAQLEDERKKLEDAQFRYEEEALTKDDIEVANKNHLERIVELEARLANERGKNERLEQDTRRLFETEEQLAKVQEEQTVNVQQQCQQDVRNKDSEIATLHRQLEEAGSALVQAQCKLADRDKQLAHAHTENSIAVQEQHATMERLHEELSAAGQLLKQKHTDSEVNLLKEVKRAEMALGAKTFDTETCTERIKELEAQVTRLEGAQAPETDTEREQRWQASTEEIRAILKDTVTELLRVRKEYALQLLDKDMALREQHIKLHYETVTVQKLKADFAVTGAELAQANNACRTRYVQQLAARNQRIETLMESVQHKSQQLHSVQLHAGNLEQQRCRTHLQLAKLEAQVASHTATHTEHTVYQARLLDDLQDAKQRAAEFERKCHGAEEQCRRLRDTRLQHEHQFRAIIDTSKDSNAQLAVMNEALRNVEQSLATVRVEMARKLDAAAADEQRLKFELESARDQCRMDRQHVEQQLQVAQQAEAALHGQLQLVSTELMRTQQTLYEQQLTGLVNDTDLAAAAAGGKQSDADADKIRELEQMLEVSIAERERAAAELTRRIEELATERDQTKQLVKEKTELLVDAEAKVKVYLTTQDLLHGQQLTALRTSVEQHKRQLAENDARMSAHATDIEQLTQVRSVLEAQLSEHTHTEQANAQLKLQLALTETRATELSEQAAGLAAEQARCTRLLGEREERIRVLSGQLEQLQQGEQASASGALADIQAQMEHVVAEKKKLECTVTEKENTVVALTGQLEQIIQERGTTSETFATQETKILELNRELQTVGQERLALSNEVTDKCTQIAALTETLARAQTHLAATVQAQQTEVTQLSERVQTLQQERDGAAKSLEAMVAVQMADKARLEALVTEQQQQQQQQAQVQQTASDLAHITDTNKHHVQQISVLEDTLRHKDAALAQWQRDWDAPAANPVVIELTAKLAEQHTLVRDQAAKIDNLTERVQTVHRQRGTDSEIIAALESQLGELRAEVQRLAGETAALAAQVTDKKTELATARQCMETQSADWHRSVQAREQQVAQVTGQVAQLQLEKEHAVQAAHSQAQRIETLAGEKVDLEHTLTQHREQCVQLAEQVRLQAASDGEQTLRIAELERAVTERDTVITQLQVDVDKLRTEWTQPDNNPVVVSVRAELKDKAAQLQAAESQLDAVNTQLNTMDQQTRQLQRTWRSSVDQWKTRLLSLENIRQLAARQCDSLEEEQVKILTESSVVQMADGVVQAVQAPVQYEEFTRQVDTDRQELHTVLEKTQVLLLERERAFNTQREQCAGMQKKLDQAQRQLDAVSVPVPGGVPVKAAVPDKQAKYPERQGSPCDLATFNKMAEEKELAVGQVQFLNSIIVDMQRKNEELKTKIEILENGYLDDGGPPGDTAPLNNISRVIPPRMYCDICEMFDVHETEDCPVQMTDTDVVVRDGGGDRVLPEQRPYCDICEAFGHDTQHCDADETY